MPSGRAGSSQDGRASDGELVESGRIVAYMINKGAAPAKYVAPDWIVKALFRTLSEAKTEVLVALSEYKAFSPERRTHLAQKLNWLDSQMVDFAVCVYEENLTLKAVKIRAKAEESVSTDPTIPLESQEKAIQEEESVAGAAEQGHSP